VGDTTDGKLLITMKKSILFLLFLGWILPSQAQQIPYSGNGLFELIGQYTSSSGMQELREFMAKDAGTRFSETAWFSKKYGLDIGLKHGKVVRVFVHGKSPYNYGIQPFVAEFPLGVNYTNSESSVVSALGEPAERKSWGALNYYVKHKEKSYYVSVEMNSDRKSLKHIFFKDNENNKPITINTTAFGGGGNATVSTNKREEEEIEMLEEFTSDKTGCISGDCTNGTGTYNYEKDGRYVGEHKNGKRHGFGTFYFPNGDSYVGEWKENSQVGYGIYEYVTAGKYLKYMGEWKNGKREGFGLMLQQDETSRIGKWLNGTYTESVEAGCLYGDCENSFSTYVWEDDGSQYAGKYANGKRNGIGIYHYGKGGTYSGNFVDGVREGKGTYYFPNGSRYIGAWKNDRRNGYGELHQKGGKIAKGDWKNGKLVSKRD
jgi:hypothetical protein